MVEYTDFLVVIVGAVIAQALGLYYVLKIKRFIGKLPTILISSQNAVWGVWNSVVIYAILFPAQKPQPIVLIGILVALVLPIVAAFTNFTWQYILYRSMPKKSKIVP